MVIKTSLDAYIPSDATKISSDFKIVMGGDINKMSISSSASAPSDDFSTIEADLSIN